MARNTDPSPRRNHPAKGVAVRAFLGRGSPGPWLDPGCGASGSWVVLIGRDCEVPGNGIRRAVLGPGQGLEWRRIRQGPSAVCRPIHQRQALDALELTHVVTDEGRADRQGMAGDP